MPSESIGAVDRPPPNQVQRPRHPVREPAFVPNGQPMTAEPLPSGPLQTHVGVLEMHPKGYGFFRSVPAITLAQPTDPYVPGRSSRACPARGDATAGPVEPGGASAGLRLFTSTPSGDGSAEVSAAQIRRLTPIDRLSTFASRPATEPTDDARHGPA